MSTKTNNLEVIKKELVNFEGEYDIDNEYNQYMVKDINDLPKEIKKELEKFPEGGDKSITIQRYESNLLADAYEAIQKQRIAAGNRISAIKRNVDESTVGTNSAFLWYYSNLVSMEKSLTKAIDSYSKSSRTGRWLREIKGIGPVKAVKLMSFLDVTKCSHYNQFHSYAGLNDNNRPWLGAEKSSNIIRKILDNRSEVLDTLKDINIITVKSIEEVINEYPNDDHPKVQMIKSFLSDKKSYLIQTFLQTLL